MALRMDAVRIKHEEDTKESKVSSKRLFFMAVLN